MKSQAFVYRWRNTITRQWYIGYHKGSEDDGYICSSVIAKPIIEHNLNEWTRKVLRRGTHKEMVDLERNLLTKLQARTNSKSYNRCNGNGTCYGGRTKGVFNSDYQKNPDLRPEALRKLGNKGIVEKFKQESDPNRKVLFHKFFLTVLTG